MKVVKCLLQNGACNNSAATCSFHSGQQNVSDELKTWLEGTNVKHTMFTIFSFTCRAKASSQDVNLSKEVQAKLQNSQMVIDFLDNDLTTLFTNDQKVSKVKNPNIKQNPSSDISFMFTKIAEKT